MDSLQMNILRKCLSTCRDPRSNCPWTRRFCTFNNSSQLKNSVSDNAAFQNLRFSSTPIIPWSQVNKPRSVPEVKAVCKYCYEKHPPAKCLSYGKFCNRCGKRNLFCIMCRSNEGTKSANEVEFYHSQDAMADVYVMSSPGKKTMKDVTIDAITDAILFRFWRNDHSKQLLEENG